MSSSSSSSISTTTVNGTTRITGLSSGLDVDSIVSQMMVAEKAKKLNKLEQAEQKATWTQTSYRTLTSDIQTFSSKYFDVASSTSLLSSNNYLKNTATSSDTAVTVTAASSAAAGTHTIAVSQIATKATLSSSASISKDVQGSTTPTLTSSALSGESFVMTLDGTAYTVSLDDVTSLTTLQTAVDTAVGSGKITVSEDTSGYLTMTSADSGVNSITLSAPTTGTSGLTNLGFGSTAILSNRLATTSTLSTVASQLNSSLSALTFVDGEATLSINGTSLTFDETDTLAEMMSEVNDSAAGVTMSYNSVSGKLVMTADSTGAGGTLTASETTSSTMLASLFSSATAGLDAKVTIDNQALTRSSNTITLDGVTYTANQLTTSDATVTVTQNTDGVYTLLKGFADDYNTLISAINTELDATYDSDYPPLTDDQKDSMTTEQITNWETKGKVGLLANDNTLKSFISDMRESLIDSVSGLSSSVFSIGITTGSYDQKGKLTVNEDTLKSALASDPTSIVKLFTQQATTSSTGTTLSGTTVVRTLSSSNLSTRYKQEGIAYRFYDIIQKNISTIRDTAGNKGLLLEKAGTTDDASDTDNTLTTSINKYTTEVTDEKTRLNTVEDNLYTKYSKLETYINTMNTQLSSLTSANSSS